MKRSFLYLAVGALALSACTSESVLEDAVKTRNVIGFENVVNKHSRADLTASTLTKFYVYGYYTKDAATTLQVFDGTEVARENATSAWDYSTEKRYWIPGANYYFFAYSCDNAKLDTNGKAKLDITNTNAEKNLLTISDYQCDYRYQNDLIYASNVGTDFAGILGTVNEQVVGLQFHHLLSKVQAQFTSAFPAEYTMEISNVKFEKICNKGDYNQADGWGKVTRENDNYVVLASDVISTSAAADAAVASTGAAYVMPYEYKDTETDNQVEITFTLTLKVGENEVFTKAMTGKFYPKWEAGVCYTYNITIDGDAAGLKVITFETEAGIDDWTDAEGEDAAITIEWVNEDPSEENND